MSGHDFISIVLNVYSSDPTLLTSLDFQNMGLSTNPIHISCSGTEVDIGLCSLSQLGSQCPNSTLQALRCCKCIIIQWNIEIYDLWVILDLLIDIHLNLFYFPVRRHCFFQMVRIAHHFIFLCCVSAILLFIFILCSMFPVSLDYLFLIAPSVFSNVYFLRPVSCGFNVTHVSRLPILDLSLRFSITFI